MSSFDDAEAEQFISTGQLPPPAVVGKAVAEAHERFKSDTAGQNSQVYPALLRTPESLFGICVVRTNGIKAAAGDSEYEFPIMSVSKPFVFALVCAIVGPSEMRDRIGMNATGLPFNSLEGVERFGGPTNPMVNSGAIATTSLAPGSDVAAKWHFIHAGLSRFAGRDLALNEEVYRCASESNFRNQSIARLLQCFDRVYIDPTDAVELYTRQCSLNVTAKDLAVMGATLAAGGVNPFTQERVVAASVCHYVLAAMATAGMYETSGDWLYEIGLPAKSGIGGGIVMVSPGKAGVGTFAPPLDKVGNSVKGQLAGRFLSQRLGLDVFISQPDDSNGPRNL